MRNITTMISDARRRIEGNVPHLDNHDDCLSDILEILETLNERFSNGKDALRRVCDDAERWNANNAISDSSGYDAITTVRTLYGL